MPEAIVRSRLEQVRAVSERVRQRLGEVTEEKLYPESLVRRLLVDLFGSLPKANSDGTFEKDSETFGTFSSLARLLHITRQTLQYRIGKSDIESMSGITANGQLKNFYPLSEVRKICWDLEDVTPLLSEKDTIDVDGETYITVKGFARSSKLPIDAIWTEIQKTPVPFLKVKKKEGPVHHAYLLSELERRCALLPRRIVQEQGDKDLNLDLPRADADGFIQTEIGVYGTLKACASRLRISKDLLETRIVTSSLRQLRGVDSLGHFVDFYYYPDVRYNCSDLMDTRQSKP